eukprot:gene36907-62544_t
MGGLGFPIGPTTDIKNIVAKLKEWGLDYDVEWQNEYDRCLTLQRKWGNWPASKFDGVVVNGQLHNMAIKLGRVQALGKRDPPADQKGNTDADKQIAAARAFSDAPG